MEDLVDYGLEDEDKSFEPLEEFVFADVCICALEYLRDHVILTQVNVAPDDKNQGRPMKIFAVQEVRAVEAYNHH